MAYKVVHAKKDLRDLVLGQYVNIQKPDTYDGAIYKFESTLTGELAEKLCSAIDNTLLNAAPDLGAKPSDKRPYTRNGDGSVTFLFKIKEFEEGVRPFKVWDMKMKPITDVPNLTGGTVINLNFAFYVSDYKGKAFISLQPTHVQVKHAEVYEGSGGAEPTFGAGEGFEAGEDEPNFAGGHEPQEGGQSHEDF